VLLLLLLLLLPTHSPPLSLRYSEPDAWQAASGPPKWRLLRCLPRLDHEWAFDGIFMDTGAASYFNAATSAGRPPAKVLGEPGGLMLPSAVHILGVDNKSAAMAGIGLVSRGGVARGGAPQPTHLPSRPTVAADLARAGGLLVPWEVRREARRWHLESTSHLMSFIGWNCGNYSDTCARGVWFLDF